MSSADRSRSRAWSLLLAAAARRRAGTLPDAPGALRLSEDGALEDVAHDDPGAELLRGDDGAFAAGPALDPEARDFVGLHVPMLGRRDDESFVVAHLGQSVDGFIATASGHSAALTGREDFVHMHRLRALADAVLVGAGTVAADDPRLTTRLVDGPSPVRVVVDPDARLDASLGVFGDGAAPTLHVLAAGAEQAPSGTDDSGARDVVDPPGGEGDAAGSPRGERDAVGPKRDQRSLVDPSHGDRGAVGTLYVERDADGLSLPALLAALRERGIRIVFIEGGGVTVTRWLRAGLLDRLQLAVAPVLVGEGRRALALPAVGSMDETLRPRCHLHQLGQDVLWDFDLRAAADADAPADTTFRRLT